MSGRPTFSLTQLAIVIAFARMLHFEVLTGDFPLRFQNSSVGSIIEIPTFASGVGTPAFAAAKPQRMCAIAGTLLALGTFSVESM